MKKYLAFALMNLSLISFSFANGAGMNIDQKPRGTAQVDEAYTEALKMRESAPDRNENKSRAAMRANPRNEAMVESFGHVTSQEEKAQLQEEKKNEEKDKGR
jgi:hypothetical protein